MIDVDGLRAALASTPLAVHTDALLRASADALAPERHGDLVRWRQALAELPRLPATTLDLNADCIRIGSPDHTCADLAEHLQRFHPWRKGPFCIHGVHVDAEWRSDWKWRRVVPHVTPLAGRHVLDVGCGNGYYALRMIGAGAAMVLGVDPTLLYLAQFAAVRHFTGPVPAFVLPLGLEALPDSGAFDTVFSMGVLYHRRDPHEHLARLHAQLRPGGELVLETLVIIGDGDDALVPAGRYAKMKNVWSIPSPRCAERWLCEAGFEDVRCVDDTVTTTDEQRATAWMRFESLRDFLDPSDPARTVEGHPAPRRAVFIARRP
ncbi:MAG: tRNA 5-methoxyuridine(34)/uridine 5-oxyacetic acid(34) synthase CmoB [Thiohalomonadaceae bacterium]